MNDVTHILGQIEDGNGHATEKLLPLVYDELRKLAAAKMTKEDPGQTLQPTALVHEAYIRLVNVEKAQHWDSRAHFFSAAAEAMRRILVERARRKGRGKRGGNLQRCELSENDLCTHPVSDDLLDLDAAITRLGQVDPQAAELVTLRLFAGMTMDEGAQFLGISSRKAKRIWAYARAWIGREMHQ
jgi:RNA polymerase sigma factor (TIGR02999 family)